MSEYYFNYDKEPRDDILCVDMKSFYASVECVERSESLKNDACGYE